MNHWLWSAIRATAPHAPVPEPPEAIGLDGRVYTVDARFSRTEAFAVREGHVVAVGSTAEIRKLAGPATRIEDLQGRCVTPGLIDCHGHLTSLGSFAAGWLDLHDAKSFAEVAARVKESAGIAQRGEWVLGGRWDQSLWGESGFPTHHRISEAAPDVPVWLERVDGHAGLANRRALELAGITRETRSPPGGEVVRDDAGEATGIFLDNALSLVDRHIP